MAVTSCTLTRMQLPTSFDELNLGRYSLKYEVVTDAVMGHREMANAAMSSSPNALPSWGDTYVYGTDTDLVSYAQNFQIESREGHNFRYFITVNYSPLESGDHDQFQPNPINRPTIVWADRETYTRFIDSTFDGKPLVNACGRHFDMPVEEPDSHGVIVVEKNVLTLLDVLQYQRYLRFAVNKEPWSFGGILFPRRTVLAREVSAGPPITEANFTYYHVVFRFVLADGEPNANDPSGSVTTGSANWDLQILERGFQSFKENPFTPGTPILPHVLEPPNGAPEAFNLRKNGTKLPDGEPGEFNPWRIYREVDFNALQFE